MSTKERPSSQVRPEDMTPPNEHIPPDFYKGHGGADVPPRPLDQDAEDVRASHRR